MLSSAKRGKELWLRKDANRWPLNACLKRAGYQRDSTCFGKFESAIGESEDRLEVSWQDEYVLAHCSRRKSSLSRRKRGRGKWELWLVAWLFKPTPFVWLSVYSVQSYRSVRSHGEKRWKVLFGGQPQYATHTRTSGLTHTDTGALVESKSCPVCHKGK